MGSCCFSSEPTPEPAAPVYRKRAIPRRLRQQVWERDHGRRKRGRCCCCGRAITSDWWECAHVVAERNGGPTVLDNLRCCCGPCNRRMGTQNLDDYKASLA